MSDLNVLALGKNVSGANIPGAIEGIQWGCGACPEFVLGVLVADCRDTLSTVMRVKRLVTIINRLTTALVAQLIEDLRRLLSIIPIPPILNLSDIVGLLTCPLTPQAILVEQANDMISYVARNKSTVGWLPSPAEDISLMSTYTFRKGTLLTILNPADIKKRIARMISDFVREIHLLIDNFMDALGDGAAYLRLIKQFWDEIRLVVKSSDILILKTAVTKASVALVKATCPAVYARRDLPFRRFDEELTTFSYDGVLPSGFNSAAVSLCTILAEIEMKIIAWQTIPLVML